VKPSPAFWQFIAFSQGYKVLRSFSHSAQVLLAARDIPVRHKPVKSLRNEREITRTSTLILYFKRQV
ncbi:MAG: hypothetical protein KBH88_08360, partial [Bacteroidales bacterium]|nr:hypothetical protein [Bacteroidales bacterium]MBP9585116.1 hypothetical protein [Bacteroidales bacterium]